MSTHPLTEHPQSPHKVWTLVLASLGLFICALDTLVVSTALPVLRHDLNASLAELEWTVNTYNLAFACLLLTGAALGDRFGRRRMFVIGVAIFTGGSITAAFSPTIEILIIARAIQGAGAAIVMPLTLTLISEAFPIEKRGVAIGLWGGIAGLAVAAGPVVGGAIIEGIDWHWIFWLNVPIGVVLIPLSLKRLTESFGPRPHLDIVGLVLSVAGLLGLTWGLVRSTTVGWGSIEVIGTLSIGAVMLAAFLLWERKASSPMLSLTLFQERGFASANGVSFFMYAALFGALFLMSQFLQTALGYSPLAAGIRILPWTATPLVIAPIAGALSERYGNKPFMAVGLAMQAVGLAWIATIVKTDISTLELAAPLVVSGVGISMCFPTVANAIVGAVPLREAGIASGTNSTLRELGGVFGVALLAAVFAHNGAYGPPAAFVDGFKPAMWVAAALSAFGVAAALLAPSRVRETSEVIVVSPAVLADAE